MLGIFSSFKEIFEHFGLPKLQTEPARLFFWDSGFTFGSDSDKASQVRSWMIENTYRCGYFKIIKWNAYVVHNPQCIMALSNIKRHKIDVKWIGNYFMSILIPRLSHRRQHKELLILNPSGMLSEVIEQDTKLSENRFLVSIVDRMNTRWWPYSWNMYQCRTSPT